MAGMPALPKSSLWPRQGEPFDLSVYATPPAKISPGTSAERIRQQMRDGLRPAEDASPLVNRYSDPTTQRATQTPPVLARQTEPSVDFRSSATTKQTANPWLKSRLPEHSNRSTTVQDDESPASPNATRLADLKDPIRRTYRDHDAIAPEFPNPIAPGLGGPRIHYEHNPYPTCPPLIDPSAIHMSDREAASHVTGAGHSGTGQQSFSPLPPEDWLVIDEDGDATPDGKANGISTPNNKSRRQVHFPSPAYPALPALSSRGSPRSSTSPRDRSVQTPTKQARSTAGKRPPSMPEEPNVYHIMDELRMVQQRMEHIADEVDNLAVAFTKEMHASLELIPKLSLENEQLRSDLDTFGPRLLRLEGEALKEAGNQSPKEAQTTPSATTQQSLPLYDGASGRRFTPSPPPAHHDLIPRSAPVDTKSLDPSSKPSSSSPVRVTITQASADARSSRGRTTPPQTQPSEAVPSSSATRSGHRRRNNRRGGNQRSRGGSPDTAASVSPEFI